MEFTLIKSRAMTLSRSLQCRAFSRAVMDEKSLSPLFPVGGGGQWLQMTGALNQQMHLKTLFKHVKQIPNSILESYVS